MGGQRKRAAMAAVWLLLTAAPAATEQVPKRGIEDGRVLFIDYAPNNIALIVGALRQSTVIEFADDERVKMVSIGNQNAWVFFSRGNLLFLKARAAHPGSSAHVVTERADHVQRLYSINLAVHDFNPEAAKKLLPMLTVKYRYPLDEVAKRTTASNAGIAIEKTAEVSRRLASAGVTGQLSYAYSVQGDTGFEPAEVWDNGQHTMFTFAGNQEIPAIYLADDKGKEELVPKTVEGHRVIVHAIGPKFVLRRGDEVMCVFNERFDPIGIDPGTRTVSAGVARVTKLALPDASPKPAKPHQRRDRIGQDHPEQIPHWRNPAR